LFWTLPGALQPDVILRARLSELSVAEQSLGDKAGIAVGRYLGAYLGNHAADVPLLSQVGIAVDVLCPKSRKKATTISVQHAETQPLAPEQNALRLQAAAQLAAQEVVNLIAKNQHDCVQHQHSRCRNGDAEKRLMPFLGQSRKRRLAKAGVAGVKDEYPVYRTQVRPVYPTKQVFSRS
jgi:hypothetical protein